MLGIDVSKDTLACTLFDPQTQKALWSRTFANTPAGIARLLRQTPEDCPLALEPTARYSTKLPIRPIKRDALFCWPNPKRRATSCTAFKAGPKPTGWTVTTSDCMLCADLYPLIRSKRR